MKRKMKYLFVFALFFAYSSAAAQDCSKEMLAQKKGSWKAGLKGSVQNVTAADLAKEKNTLSNIHKMLQSKYDPTGCQVLFSNVFGKQPVAGKNWVADPYHYSLYILRYLCNRKSADQSKYYIDMSTPTTVNITANAIYWLNNLYAAELADDEFRGYLKLPKMPVKKEGCYFMGEEVLGDSRLPNKIKEYRWLITYNDTLPFIYLQRKEYLLLTKKRLEKTISENGASSYYDQYMNRINEYLKKPEAELNQPAICRWNDEERFEGFVAEGTKGSFIAVKPNPAYYHKKLPRSSAQFFTVVYKISEGDPVFESNIAGIKNAIDFAVLKNMLGK